MPTLDTVTGIVTTALMNADTPAPVPQAAVPLDTTTTINDYDTDPTMSSNSNPIVVIYGAFYIILRSTRPTPPQKLLLMAKSEQILRFARRDLLAAEQDAQHDSLAIKRISLIVRCVDYLLFVREIAEKLDIALVQWFYSHAITALSNPQAPKVFFILTVFSYNG